MTNSKSVLVTGLDFVTINSFNRTFSNNFKTNEEFVKSYIDEFIMLAKREGLFLKYETNEVRNWRELSKGTKDSSILYELPSNINTDYVIDFTYFQIINRISEVSYRDTNNKKGRTTNERCILNVGVSIYDGKTRKKVLEFKSKGDTSVFLFNFKKTLLKSKSRSIQRIINYLKSGDIN
ncbi:hypothetical protein [Tenacibaculum sp. 190524A05c]|uniref:hypothetical protein n=1 Tax=Tenacibaculum platacis TaxID=3137852 RepID=UPI0032B1CF49